MRKSGLLAAFVVSVLSVPLSADIEVTVTAPTIVFKTEPQTVVIEKDVRVIPEFDHEVFIVSGVYWTFWEGHWYRLPKWNGRWLRVAPAVVPARLVAFPRGKYLRYRHAQRKAAKAHHKAARKQRKERRKGRGKR